MKIKKNEKNIENRRQIATQERKLSQKPKICSDSLLLLKLDVRIDHQSSF